MAFVISSWPVHGGLLLLSSAGLPTRQNATRSYSCIPEMRWVKREAVALVVYVLGRRVMMTICVRRRLMGEGGRARCGGEVKVFCAVEHGGLT